MIESKQTEVQDHLKDFPGLGSPIIEELNNFHLIEQKLLSYHDDDAELEKFNEKFKEECKMRNGKMIVLILNSRPRDRRDLIVYLYV